MIEPPFFGMLHIVFPKADDFRRRMNRARDSRVDVLTGVIDIGNCFKPVLSEKCFADIRNVGENFSKVDDFAVSPQPRFFISLLTKSDKFHQSRLLIPDIHEISGLFFFPSL